MLLKSKRVLVTGVSDFIGRRLAQRLSTEEGANVTGSLATRDWVLAEDK